MEAQLVCLPGEAMATTEVLDAYIQDNGIRVSTLNLQWIASVLVSKYGRPF